MSIRFDNQVAIVTGAGTGLGRAYAHALAKRGARIVVNDFGGGVGGKGRSSEPAQAVVAEIKMLGGDAIANGADVTDVAQVEQMVAQSMDAFGRIDVLINNAGILRDASFAKMALSDFQKVMDVHLMGSVNCTKAVWPIMRAAGYGRILMTTSSSGLYGNFGQSNYAAAKMALIGLMNSLQIEGEKDDIRINALGPGAATRMTQDLLPQPVVDLMTPESVVPAAVFLTSKDAPRRVILNATAGGFSRTFIHETEGIYLKGETCNPESVAEQFQVISNEDGQHLYQNGGEQVMKFVGKAAAAFGVDLSASAK